MTAEVGGAPLEGFQVGAYKTADDGDGGFFWAFVADVTTDANGDYDIAELAAGTYRLIFYGGTSVLDDDYASEWYNNVIAFSPYDARCENVVVGVDQTVSNKDAALAIAGHIEGTVTAETGDAPLENVDVVAYMQIGSEWDYAGECSTGPDGTYDLSGLPVGTYRLQFYGSDGYLTECYSNVPSSDISDPRNTNISVGKGQHVSGKDAALSTASHIKGKVTAQDGGSDLSSIEIDVYRKDGADWDSVSGGSTDSTGTFDIGALREGTYRLVFLDESGEYAAECYDGVPGDDVNAAGVDDIVVGAGAIVLGKNASMVKASHITGKVTAKVGGAQLPTITVEAYAKSVDASGVTFWESANAAETNSTGDYDISGLAAGDYRLSFHDGNSTYADECYNGVPGSNVYDIECDTITVGGGATESGKNAALAKAAQITGSVTRGVVPLRGINVNAYMLRDVGDGAPGYTYEGAIQTNDVGQYELGGLGAGTYRLTFNEGSSGYSDNDLTAECYNNVPGTNVSDDRCTNIVVAEGALVSGKNADLAPGGSATIWNPGGANVSIGLSGGTEVLLAFDAATIGAVDVVTGGLPPAGPPRGFEIAGTVFDISFSGSIAPGTKYRITLPYGSLFTADEARALKVGHWKNGAWEAITPLSVDTVKRTLTFDTVGLSPFTLIKKTAIATAVSGAKVSPSKPKRNKTATFSAVVSPPDALNAGTATLTLSQKLTKTVKVRYKSKGKWKTKKKKVTYYKLRKTVAMSENAATGAVTATYKCKYKGSWKMDVTYAGDGSFTPCSTSKSFTVK